MDPLTTQLAEALRVLAWHAEDTDCRHDETYRAGVQWTVCCSCDVRWADDAGGVPEHAVYPALRTAAEALAAYDERVRAEDAKREIAGMVRGAKRSINLPAIDTGD